MLRRARDGGDAALERRLAVFPASHRGLVLALRFWSPDHRTWRVQSKSGVNFELGVPLDGSDYTGALERSPSRPDEIYRWQLVRQYDSHGDPDAVPPAPSSLIVFRYFPGRQSRLPLRRLLHATCE